MEHRWGNLSSLGTIGGALVALIVGEFFGYWLHRASHRTLLWRAYHQVHHSAERIDIYGSAFIHPLELVVSGVVGSFVSTVLLGVTPNAAALAGLAGIFLAMFQHLNVKTPVWLGYIVQRPESHSIHHQRGHHASNYANLPIYDLVFGTFKNPELFAADAGFYPGASGRILEMMVGLDVSVPRSDQRVSPKSSLVPM
jgi:sterol desaturase/sphingolipid hydroxylase (fatty acid hydroxylase superfamily)